MGGAKAGRKKDQKYVFNVGGVRHETYRATLYSVPNTRLYSIAKKNPRDAEEFDSECREFFFDRHPGAFEQIINFYRTGKLHCPMDICGPMFEEELRYWGIEEKLIEPCCWMNYIKHRDAEASMNLFDGTKPEPNSSDEDADDDELTSTAAKFGMSEVSKKQKTRWEKLKPRMWRLIDDPYSSFGANIITLISMTFIVVSIIGFCLETHRWGRNPVPISPASSLSLSPSPFFSSGKSSPKTSLTAATTPPITTADPFGLMDDPNQFPPIYPPFPAPEHRGKTVPKKYLTILDYICSIWFTFEFIVRLIFCPDRVLFFKTMLNLIDLLAIVPFYVQILADKTDIVVSMWEIIKILRIFRVFKLCRHVIGLKVLVHTLRASARELILLILFLVLGVVIFSSLLHYAEYIHLAEDARVYSNFDSIPSGFWWAVITMTTIGYGDQVPETIFGRIVGALCAICGVLTISLPVPVIVNNFTLYYNHAQARLKLPPKKRRHVDKLAGAAEALKQQEEDEIKEGASFDDEYSEHHPGFETGFESEIEPSDIGLISPPPGSTNKKLFKNSPGTSIKFVEKGAVKIRKQKQGSGLSGPSKSSMSVPGRSGSDPPGAADSIFITCGSDAESDPDLHQMKSCDYRDNFFNNSRLNLASLGAESLKRERKDSKNHSSNGPLLFPNISQTSIRSNPPALASQPAKQEHFQFCIDRPSALDVRSSQLELHHPNESGRGACSNLSLRPENASPLSDNKIPSDSLSPSLALPRSPSLTAARSISRRNSFIPRSLTKETSSPNLQQKDHQASLNYHEQSSLFVHPATLTDIAHDSPFDRYGQCTPPRNTSKEYSPEKRRWRRRRVGSGPGTTGGGGVNDSDQLTHSSANSSDCQPYSDENEPLTFPFIGQ